MNANMLISYRFYFALFGQASSKPPETPAPPRSRRATASRQRPPLVASAQLVPVQNLVERAHIGFRFAFRDHVAEPIDAEALAPRIASERLREGRDHGVIVHLGINPGHYFRAVVVREGAPRKQQVGETKAGHPGARRRAWTHGSDYRRGSLPGGPRRVRGSGRSAPRARSFPARLEGCARNILMNAATAARDESAAERTGMRLT
jgi:hypothetical protein